MEIKARLKKVIDGGPNVRPFKSTLHGYDKNNKDKVVGRLLFKICVKNRAKSLVIFVEKCYYS